MRDVDVRRALRREMNSLHPDRTDTLIVEELGICQGIARVDLAVVNGTFHGFEIKSERDTLSRLPYQADIYSQALEYVTIVAAPSHLAGVRDVVPAWWGVWSATQGKQGEVQLVVRRRARRNPSLQVEALVQFLWRDEALQILLDYNLAGGMISKSRQHIWNRLSTNFTVDEIGELVRSRLKQRASGWRVPA